MATVFWFTGLSGAGKTTLSCLLADRLRCAGKAVCILDADEVRATLCSDLGFSVDDRTENIRRLASVAALLSTQGIVVCVAAITPRQSMQEMVRTLLPNCILIFCDATLETVKARDPKGLYRKAAAGEIKKFTGISDIYEPPDQPDAHIDTNCEQSITESIELLLTLDKFHLNR